MYTVIGAVYTVIISPSCCGRSPLSSSLSLHRLFFSSLSLPASTMVFTRSLQLVLKAPLTAILTHDFNLLYHMCQKLVPAAVYQLCLFNLTAPVCTQPHCRCGGYDRILERRHCCVKPGPRTVNQLLGTDAQHSLLVDHHCPAEAALITDAEKIRCCRWERHTLRQSTLV